MTIFLKVKKFELLLILLYEYGQIKNNLSTIRCAIIFDIDLVITVFVYLRFFLFKKWIIVCTNFFLYDSEPASGIMFNLRQPVKRVNFHSE
jgi:hypothetical protein